MAVGVKNAREKLLLRKELVRVVPKKKPLKTTLLIVAFLFPEIIAVFGERGITIFMRRSHPGGPRAQGDNWRIDGGQAGGWVGGLQC